MAKLTTAEILALARQQDGGGSGDAPAASAEASAPEPEAPAAEETPAAEDAPAEEPAKPAAASTAGMSPLERARAEGAAGAAKPAAPAGGKKLSPLEQARQQGAGGGAKPAAAAGGKKLSPLEQARQQGAVGGAGAAAKAAPAKKAAAAKASPDKPAPSTDGKSVQEMIEAARKPQGPEAASKPAGPKLPGKPLAAARKPVPAKKPATESRRGVLAALVLSPFALAWLLFCTASGAFTLALARFMMPNVLVEPPTRFKIGAPGDFPPETVITKFKAERGIWVVNTSSYNGKQTIYALSSVCTHLGCTPNWLEGEQKYKCPCHGSGFYINGINFEGPAPRPLERVGLSVAADGMLEVDKSLKFQQEMGQWEDAASFVEV